MHLYPEQRPEGGEIAAMNPLRGPVSWAKNRLVQSGVTISDGIYTANSLHLDGKMIVRLQEDCEVPNYALMTFLHI